MPALFRLRADAALLIAATLAFSWYAMMIVHEAGHIAAAVLTGGHPQRPILPLIGFSRTDVAPNSHPPAVAWGGPVIGILLPAAIWLACRALAPRAAPVFRFWTGFCLIVNGVYLALGTPDRIGDAGDLIRAGVPPWMLWAFGAITISMGLACWHRAGEPFGIGRSPRPVDRHAVLAALIGLAVAMIILVVAAIA